MTLEMMGNIGEFVGGLAVVVSLLYLAVQIRQNSKTVRVAAYQSLNDMNTRVLLAMAEGPPAAETFTKGLPDIGSLSPAEFFQFQTLVSSMFMGFQTTYYQHRDGLLSDEQWRRHRGVMRWWLTHPGVQSTLRFLGPSFDPDFLRQLAPRTSTASGHSGTASAAQQAVEPDVE